MDRREHRVQTDPVADEVRRVLRPHDALAEHLAAEVLDARLVIGRGLRDPRRARAASCSEAGSAKCITMKLFLNASPRPTSMSAIRRPDVFDAITACGAASFSSFSNSACLMSSRSTIASRIRSQSRTFARSSSKLPVVTSTALRGCVNDAGFDFLSFSSAPFAKALRPPLPSGGTISRSTTGMPAFAQWAAMPLPMTPAPRTATRRIG